MNSASEQVCMCRITYSQTVLSCVVCRNIYWGVIHTHLKDMQMTGAPVSQEQKSRYFEKHWGVAIIRTV